jgi:predicted nucleic acid-binding protein
MFCLMEPLFTLEGRRKNRKGLSRDLNTEVEQYMREATGQADVPAILSTLNTLLIERGDAQQHRFIAVVGELMEVGIQLLPLDALVWQQLPAILSTTELQFGDALVYASITHSLATSRPEGLTLFATRDTDFKKDDIIKQQLARHDCAMLFDFSAALARITA